MVKPYALSTLPRPPFSNIRMGMECFPLKIIIYVCIYRQTANDSDVYSNNLVVLLKLSAFFHSILIIFIPSLIETIGMWNFA